MKRILIIEDDQMLSSGLRFDLEADGYVVNTAYTIKQALESIEHKEYDLIVIDVNLPDGNGFFLCSKIKERKDIPIIFLTACDMESDQIKGFDLGADDYITKPFSMPLFRKRVSVVLKRNENANIKNLYSDGYLIINFDTLEAIKDSETISLTATEYKLLKLFISNAGIVLTRQIFLERLWDNDGNFVDEHTLTVNINRLRSKIESPNHKYIKTIYGMGYQWAGEKL
ncbi:response regulator transcription factor [Clostridium sp. MSJ-11]|uniref:Response regulator transcription factor n=1 Tax=Clostridium mobile TaxID=2841512 RepID=A0ABS6EK68_9CLOT|nr:response regulator transcription factor [Clostridium mobile]